MQDPSASDKINPSIQHNSMLSDSTLSSAQNDSVNERSPKRQRIDEPSSTTSLSNAEENVGAVESDSSQIDIGGGGSSSSNTNDVQQQRPSTEENPSFCDQNFDDDDDDESDEDWADGANNDEDNDGGGSSSDESESSNYELITPAGIPEDDENEEFEYPWTSFTQEESDALQDEVKEIGLMKFMEKYLLNQQVPPLKLMEAFNVVMHPGAALALSELQQCAILRQVINRHLRKRNRLEHVNTLEDVVSLLAKANNVMIVTGAGVSVSCGIPDFRSETGIYSRLQEFELDDPQQMFDIKYFRENPQIFYSFAKELYPSNYEPSPSHLFVKLMEEKGKLLRNYTQNIDTLEHKANIKRIVNCHGSFATASCVTCGYKCDGKEIEQYIFQQKVPPCPKCAVEDADNALNKPRKDDDDDDDDDGRPKHQGISVMKPDITFFGESLPAEFDRLLALDTEVVDLLIVMGSSLKVSPVSEIMSQIPHSVPQILINRTPITHMTFDMQLLGDCDVIVPELCRMLGWDLRHEKLPGGSAQSDESLRQSKEDGDGDWVEIVDPVTKELKHKEKKIWRFRRDGLYTFPGAVVSDRYLEQSRSGAHASSSSSESEGESDNDNQPSEEQHHQQAEQVASTSEESGQPDTASNINDNNNSTIS
ncbi:sir2-domain-containing protein [Lichtheimia corymbifera JMRC:FSU:9682]|uniref:Sir2-domain-containing protein n=1 Tax=Lichtheimia corymbifera JMRC:FSU:9682 TaxID=1263082 RepID=A0A068RL82_9FUNG|nr:sir2-domain-containing protein [Lichtheimia corymbifera JMRC:FSU:9682]